MTQTQSVPAISAPRSPFVVEAMTRADVPAVVTIERLSFVLPWSPGSFYSDLAHNDHAHYVVVRDQGTGQIHAYGGFWLLVDEAHINTIAVHPDWRGLGLGELVMMHLLRKGLEVGSLLATLEVRLTNRVAQNLYRKLGFEIVGRRKRYYSDNNEDAYIMTLPQLDRAWINTHLGEVETNVAHRWPNQRAPIP